MKKQKKRITTLLLVFCMLATTLSGFKVQAEEDDTVTVTVNITHIGQGESYDLLEGVTAVDAEGTPLTVTCDASELKPTIPGRYKVNYTATDKDGIDQKKSVIVTVAEKESHNITVTWTDNNGGTVIRNDGKPLANGEVIQVEHNQNSPDFSIQPAEGYVYKLYANGNLLEPTNSPNNITYQFAEVYKDNTLNVIFHAIPVINVSPSKTIFVGDSFDPLEGVTANDKEDGDLTKELTYVVRKDGATVDSVDTTKAGNYEIIYCVTDKDGLAYGKQVRVTVKEKGTYTFTISWKGNGNILLNDETLLTENPSVITVEEKGSIRLVVTPKPGSINYTISEDGGAPRNLNDAKYVYEKKNSVDCDHTLHFVFNDLPVIDAKDKTLNVGDSFSPLAGVTANDTEEGDLTDKIELVSSKVDMNTPGTYYVTVKVDDSMDGSVEKTFKVIVKKKESKPDKPNKPSEPAPTEPETQAPTQPAPAPEVPKSPATGGMTATGLLSLLTLSGSALAIFADKKRR